MRRFGGRALGRRRLLLSQVDASPQLVIFRESGGSSTPQLLDSSISVSGILDRPLSRTMTAAGVARSDSIFKYRLQAQLRILAARCAEFASFNGDIQLSWLLTRTNHRNT
jgi:hypothetical protein